MPDIENVIKGLEWVLENMVDPFNDFRFAGYDGPIVLLNEPIVRDALALLKAQEPRNAIVVSNGIGMSGGWWYQCPSCKMEIKPRDRYCRSCGQAVKWE